MKEINIQAAVDINSIIGAVHAGGLDIDELCVYAKEDVYQLEGDLICYLDECPEILNDTEVFSEFVRSKSLEFIYDGQQFKDVVYHAYGQKPSATMSEVVAALNYFMDNDDFLDIV